MIIDFDPRTLWAMCPTVAAPSAWRHKLLAIPLQLCTVRQVVSLMKRRRESDNEASLVVDIL